MTEAETTQQAALAELEGRLIAQRRLLARLLLALPADQRAGLLDWLSAQASPHDGQEDPGAVLTGAEILPLSLADEFREIAALVAAGR